MRWFHFALVLWFCGSSVRAFAEEDGAKPPEKRLLLVSETRESREQALASGLFFLQKFYEADSAFRIKQIAQTDLAEALPDEYDMVVLYAISQLAKQQRDALKQYQLSGGALIWFLQGNADRQFYRSLAGEMDRPLLPVSLDEYVELAEDRSASIIDASLLPKELAGGELFFRGYWKTQAGKTTEHTIRALILSDGIPGVVYNDHSRTAVVLVATQPALSNWTKEPGWVVFLAELHAILRPDPNGKELGGAAAGGAAAGGR